MTAMQLRTELLREISSLLDNETALKRVIAFVKPFLLKNVVAENKGKSYKVIPVSPEIKK